MKYLFLSIFLGGILICNTAYANTSIDDGLFDNASTVVPEYPGYDKPGYYKGCRPGIAEYSKALYDERYREYAAEGDYKEALKKNSNLLGARLKLSYIYAFEDHYSAAVKELKIILATKTLTNHQRSVIYTDLGQTENERHNYRAAIQYLKKAVACQDPANWAAQKMLEENDEDLYNWHGSILKDRP